MGRKKVFETPEKFGEVITEFIEHCKANNIFPSDYQLREYSGIEYATLYNYTTGGKAVENGDKYKPYFEQYKKLVQFREDYIIQQGNRDPKKTSFSIFLLKQQKNGGYTDHPSIDISAKELTVNVKGLGENAAD